MKLNRPYNILILSALCVWGLCLSCQVDQQGFEVVERHGIDMGYGLCIAGTHLYATTNDGVEIFAMLAGGKLRHVESVDVGAPCFAVAVRDSIAYVGGESGVTALRLSEDGPTEVLSRCIDGGTFIHSMSIQDSMLFVSDYHKGLTIMDGSDVGDLRAIGHVGFPQGSWELARIGNILYLANTTRGLLVFDVSTPSEPKLTAEADSSQGARSICISGDTLYLGTTANGLKLYDIATAATPTMIGSMFPSEEVYVYHVEGGLIYCQRPERGVTVYRYDSRYPQEVAHYYTGLHHGGLYRDGLVYFVGRAVYVIRPVL